MGVALPWAITELAMSTDSVNEAASTLTIACMGIGDVLGAAMLKERKGWLQLGKHKQTAQWIDILVLVAGNFIQLRFEGIRALIQDCS